MVRLLTAVLVLAVCASALAADPAIADLEFGSPQPSPSGAVRVPVYLRSRIDVSVGAFSVGLGFKDSSLTLAFVAVEERTPTLVDNGLPGALAVAWLESFDLSGGERTLLGYVEFEGPEDLASLLEVFGVVANTPDGSNLNVSVPRAR